MTKHKRGHKKVKKQARAIRPTHQRPTTPLTRQEIIKFVDRWMAQQTRR